MDHDTTSPAAGGAHAAPATALTSASPVDEQAPRRAVVQAKDLQLTSSRGLVYGPVSLHVDEGDLVVLQGPQGAGRTSLLLTLAGRMNPDRSTRQLTVLGHQLPRERLAVQRAAGIAGFDRIDDLDESVTVSDCLRERLAWLAPWYRRTPRVTAETYRALAGPVFGSRVLPALDTVVWDLDEVDAMLLRITVAMTARPRLLVVDDLDQVHDAARRQIVWDRLAALAATGITVIASVASAGEVQAMTWATAPHVVRLATGPQLDA